MISFDFFFLINILKTIQLCIEIIISLWWDFQLEESEDSPVHQAQMSWSGEEWMWIHFAGDWSNHVLTWITKHVLEENEHWPDIAVTVKMPSCQQIPRQILNTGDQHHPHLIDNKAWRGWMCFPKQQWKWGFLHFSQGCRSPHQVLKKDLQWLEKTHLTTGYTETTIYKHVRGQLLPWFSIKLKVFICII